MTRARSPRTGGGDDRIVMVMRRNLRHRPDRHHVGNGIGIGSAAGRRARLRGSSPGARAGGAPRRHRSQRGRCAVCSARARGVWTPAICSGIVAGYPNSPRETGELGSIGPGSRLPPRLAALSADPCRSCRRPLLRWPPILAAVAARAPSALPHFPRSLPRRRRGCRDPRRGCRSRGPPQPDPGGYSAATALRGRNRTAKPRSPSRPTAAGNSGTAALGSPHRARKSVKRSPDPSNRASDTTAVVGTAYNRALPAAFAHDRSPSRWRRPR